MQLAAAREERPHVRIRGVHDQVLGQVALHDVLVEVERLPVPVRILEHDVAILVVGHGLQLGACGLRAPSELAARHERREELLLRARVHRVRVDLPGRRHLRRRQARRTVALLAEQHRGIEPALPRIVDQAVLQPVARVARGERRLVNDRILGGRDVARRIPQHRIGDPERDGRAVRRRAGDDAVVVLREHLRGLEPLSSARRAAVPVGQLRARAVEGLDDLLGLRGHLVLGAPREVHELLGMPEREGAAAADVTGVGRRRGIAGSQRLGHVRIADDARPATVADRLILAVPGSVARRAFGGRHRQPDLDLDVGVARRRQRRGDAAERTQRLVGVRAARRAAGRLERAGGHDLRFRDGRVLERQRRQALARGGRKRSSRAGRPGRPRRTPSTSSSCSLSSEPSTRLTGTSRRSRAPGRGRLS